MKYNSLYDNGRNLFALGDIKWKPNGSIIRAILIDPFEYTPEFDKHKTLSDIPDKAKHFSDKHPDESEMPQLQLITPINGICDSGDIKFVGIPKGSKIGYLILYIEDKNNSLICCCNIGGKSDFFKSSGRPIIISWSNNEDKIFKL